MCGIAGIVNVGGGGGAPDREALVRMAAALRHRGPDEFGIYRDASAGLAHARLSIIDLSSGQQPLANEDSSLWVVFNGEIFNYVELREELVRAGHRFRTKSDTEVIVHAYEQWGGESFSRMNGQWAVALWDEGRKRLVLARDRLGVRPLFVCRRGPLLYFASEAKAIFAADEGIPRALDPIGLEQTFTFWSAVAPHTSFQGIEEVMPGHIRTYENGAVREHAVWAPRYPDPPRRAEYDGSIEDATRAVRSALEHATSLRVLRSDVPVGSYLSGGLDSSLVAALGRRVAGSRFQTFSLRFEDAEYDETEFQRAMVAELGSQHHEVMVSAADIARAFPDAVYHAERPILRTAPVPLYLLSRLVKAQGIKVVLTGEGADEMFAGYDLFREGKVRRFWARHPDSRLRPMLLSRLYPYLARSPVSEQAMARKFFGRNLDELHAPWFTHDTRWHTTSALKRLFSKAVRDAVANRDVVGEFCDTLPPEFPRWSPLARDQYVEIRTLLSSYLLSSQGDRMLMANSVEGRFPFLDRDVVELANSLPPAFKLRVLDEKHVLKRAARGLVPEAILSRKKQPYRAPDALAFFRGAPPEYALDLLAERAVLDAGLFEVKAVAQLLQKCRARAASGQFSNTDNMALVGVLSAQLLHHFFVRRRPEAGTVRLTTDIDHTRPHPKTQSP